MGGRRDDASSGATRLVRRAVAAGALTTALALVMLVGPSAGADDVVVPVSDPVLTVDPPVDSPADTTPPPDDPPATTAPPTTVPEPTPTTTAPPTTTPTTTSPAGAPTTTVPSPTSTSGPPTTTTTPGPVPTLDPADPLMPRPELAALGARVRAQIDALQYATDAYALRRFEWMDLVPQLPPAQVALDQARAAELVAVTNEILGLAKASTDEDLHASVGRTHRRPRRAVLDERLESFRASKRLLVADRRDARSARARAETTFTDLSARLDRLVRAVFDTGRARAEAESDLEHDLGPDAVRARPDGFTFELALEQAGQPDPIVLGRIGRPIPDAQLSSPFGLRADPLGGGAGFHPGLDLAAVAGTPIRAAADGTVVTAGDCGGYGNCVVVDHGVSLATLYGHQSVVLVTAGQPVVAGQVIGLVGSTGMSTGPHLHFELRLHGIPIDPLLALAPA